jgi:hypothetical protein
MSSGQVGRRWFRLGGGCEWTPRDAANANRFSRWSLVWALGFVAATVAIEAEWVSGALALVVATAPLLAGGAALVAYARFLQDVDELQRKIQLEGLAMGFGAGLLFMMGWRLFERLGAPQLDVSDPVLVMVVAFALGQWLGARRYA